MSFSTWILASGDTLQFVLFFSFLAAFAVAERFAPRRPGTMDRAIRWPTNFFLTAVNIVAMGALPISFIGAALWAETHRWGILNQIRMPLLALVPVTLLARGFISFSTHYLMHMVPLFWRVHRVHHLDTELDVSTTVRFHPLDLVFGTFRAGPRDGHERMRLGLDEVRGRDAHRPLWLLGSVILPAGMRRCATRLQSTRGEQHERSA